MNTPNHITIGLNQLVHSTANVRNRGVKEGIEELAASILAHGLRQNLNVRDAGDGKYEVVAGGRRLRALKLLAKQKQVAKDLPVACVLVEDESTAREISLAENVQRLNMHPLDEFEAFQALVDGGAFVDDIARRFGVTPTHVQRRLKLASVAPKIRKLYQDGHVTLEQLMAFTVSDDPATQLRVYSDLPDWNRSPVDIRAALMEEALRADEPFALFVGINAYMAAGGGVTRDLFDMAHEGYLTDRVLLMNLANAKLEAAVEEVRAEGWKWAKAELERDWTTPYGRVHPVTADGEDGEGDNPSPSMTFDPEDMARAGAVLRIGRDGTLTVDRGLVHPDDKPRREVEPAATTKPEAGGLPVSIIEDVTAHRTAALRLALAGNPAVALASVAHAMARSLLHPYGARGCIGVSAASENLGRYITVADDSPAHGAMDAIAAEWAQVMPRDPAELFGWCLAQPQEVLLNLIAYLAALSVNAVAARHDPEGAGRLRHADELSNALALDMTQHWMPSVEGFYGRLSKGTLVQMVTDAKVELPVNLSSLKRAEAAKHVRDAMQGSGWLPQPLQPLHAAA